MLMLQQIAIAIFCKKEKTVSNKVFDIKRVTVDVPAYALRVQRNYMEPGARMKDGKPICIPMLR